MIKTIRIQNFRSLQDVTLDLQEVNLLIGPNNSGKSNLLKALKFLGEFFEGTLSATIDEIKHYFFLKKFFQHELDGLPPISFTIIVQPDRVPFIYRMEFYGVDNHGDPIVNQFIGHFDLNFETGEKKLDYLDLNDVPVLNQAFYKFSLQKHNNENHSKGVRPVPKGASYKDFLRAENMPVGVDIINEIRHTFKEVGIYSIDLASLKRPYPTLEEDYVVNSSASNLVAFLDNMRDNKPQIMDAINSNLKECIKEFESVSFEKVKLPKDHDLRKIHDDKTFKRLGVQDKYGQIYWAGELSDGTLYFLALLAIIHQPYPPKLLMVEEPENGIHPRRIKEIIDYFFTIAEEKGIQVILTTHSTVVIDQFKDLPESIFVFDKKDQSTQIRNLLTDIIAEDKQKSKKLHVPELDLSGSLGDHWAAGLIGGVPR